MRYASRLLVGASDLYHRSSSLTTYVSGCVRTNILTIRRYRRALQISETVEKDAASSMQQAADELTEWFETNRMNINCKKTKEMILGPISKESSTPLLMAAKPVQRVAEYKLLGVTVNTIMKWDDHINNITSKAA